MEAVIFWGLPVLCALIGWKRQLFGSWLTFWHTLFAFYLGFWSAPQLAQQLSGMLPPNLQDFGCTIAFAATFLVVWIILFFVIKAVNKENEEEEFSFQKLFNRGGGALCGFGTGLVLSTFIAALFVFSPVRNRAGGMANLETTTDQTIGRLWKITNFVNRMTFQSGRTEAFALQRDQMLDTAKKAAENLDARLAESASGEEGESAPESGEESGEAPAAASGENNGGGSAPPKQGLVRRLVDPAVRGQESVNDRTNREL